MVGMGSKWNGVKQWRMKTRKNNDVLEWRGSIFIFAFGSRYVYVPCMVDSPWD